MTRFFRFSIIISFFVFIPFIQCAQFNKIDSLKKRFVTEKIPYRKAGLVARIGDAMYFENNDSARKYYRSSLQLLRNLALQGTNSAADSAEKYQSFPLACISYDLAVRGELDSSLHYYQEELRIDKKYGNPADIAGVFANMGTIYKRMNLVGKAMDCFQQSLKITEKNGFDDISAQTLNGIGILCRANGDMESAKKYFVRAMEYYEKTGNKAGIANLTNTLATILESEKKFDEALKLLNKSLRLTEEMHFTEGKAFVLNNIGTYYIRLEDYQKAIPYFEQSLDIRRKLGQESEMALSMKNLVNVYMDLHNEKMASGYAVQLMALLPKISVLAIKKEILFELFRFARYKKDYRHAFDYFEKYVAAKDSTAGEEQKKSFLKKQMQYEYEKKAAADSVKNIEAQKVKDAQLAAQTASLKQEKFQRYSLIVGLLVVLIGLGFVINRFRITQKQKKIIEKQKLKVDEAFDKLHEKNKEVMDSIRYAKRIQQALLTPEI